MESYEQMLKAVLSSLPTRLKERKRFQIPIVRVERVGLRTVIRNFKELAEVTRREQEHLAKFLGKQLATINWIRGNELVLQGVLRSEQVQQKFNEYVEHYVICKACRNPDTQLLKEDRFLFLRCEACGCRYPVEKF